MRKNIIILIYLFSLVSNISYPQFGWDSKYDPNNFIGLQLWSKIDLEFGYQFEFEYFILDSMFNKDWVYDEISDPYQQLQGKVLFIAYPEYGLSYDRPDSAIIGIFGDGQILWHTDYISIVKIDTSVYDEYYHYSISPQIFSIRDLNLDGLVDISIMCNELWIISWDGSTGTIINDIDPTDRSSKLLSSDSFRLIYTNNDDILEILSYWFEYDSTSSRFPPINIPTRPYVTYGWNGLKYGLWDNVVQIGLNEFPIANKLSGYVKCKLNFNALDDSSFLYNYTIHNFNHSKQSIETFVLENMTNSKSVYSPLGEWFNFEFDSTGVGWFVKFSNQKINPSKSKNGFIIKATGLPSISRFYLLADGSRIVYGPDLGKPYNIMTEINNYRTNSYSGYTLSPIDPLDSIVILDFIDTLIYYNQESLELNWITNQSIFIKYDSLFNLAKTQLQQSNNNGARTTLQTVLQQVDIDSTNNLTSEAYALIRYNTEYLLEKIPQSSPNLVVNLKNSLGNQIPASNVKYYEGSWKDAVNNRDGTFTVITTKPTVSIRVFYEYASQQVDNVVAQNSTYTFTTVNAAIQLKNSLDNLIDEGTVQYYAGAWRSFGTTSNGIAYKELLPINYSFRMTYEYGSIDKQQNLSTDPTVVFQTVNSTVKLLNSQNALIDQGTVQYYAGAWRSFGTTSNGVAYKELLPINYSFRMGYEYISKDKQQNLSTNPVVDFNTVLCSVKVSKTSDNQPINNARVKYYAGAWRNFGTTNPDGFATKELLPANLSFRATSGSVSLDKQQDIVVNNLVEILLNIP